MAVVLSATPPASKEEFVYETLKEAILSGHLRPGDSLVQTELAQNLGVSPIPIRTVISRLIAEGLVIQEPYRSPRVSELSVRELKEVLLIRMHLEVLAAKYSFPNIHEELLAELWCMVEQMDDALASQEYERFGILNRDFHGKLYAACPLSLLKQMINDLWDNSDRYRSRSIFLVVSGLAEHSQQDHRRIVELIESGDFEEAEALLDRHKTRAREQFFRVLDVPPEPMAEPADTAR